MNCIVCIAASVYFKYVIQIVQNNHIHFCVQDLILLLMMENSITATKL